MARPLRIEFPGALACRRIVAMAKKNRVSAGMLISAEVNLGGRTVMEYLLIAGAEGHA